MILRGMAPGMTLRPPRLDAMDPLDFTELVDRYYAMLYRFALSLAHNEADACDLTQHTFAVWASKGHSLRDASKVKSWLFTTLYREFISTRRREQRWPKEELSTVEDELPAVSPDAVDSLQSGQVMAALQTLDENFRVPLVLFYLQEHSYEEIARILDVPIGTVMSRLSRGRLKLQRALTDPRTTDSDVIHLPMRKAKGEPSHG
jgi:RNA polymerase sigma-70 factor (ECF subfamily)